MPKRPRGRPTLYKNGEDFHVILDPDTAKAVRDWSRDEDRSVSSLLRTAIKKLVAGRVAA